MLVNSAEFFFSEYAGYTPEDRQKIKITKGMIEHYMESGLARKLRKIYEACAKDGCMHPGNIPRYLWKDNNLIAENRIYLHKKLKLVPPAPVYDFASGHNTVSQYYCEMAEFFSEDDVLEYAYSIINIPPINKDKKRDAGMVHYLLVKYLPLVAEGIQPLDMVLFTIDEAAGECKKLSAITDFEENAYKKALAYRRKLEGMGKYGIQWRFPWQNS